VLSIAKRKDRHRSPNLTQPCRRVQAVCLPLASAAHATRRLSASAPVIHCLSLILDCSAATLPAPPTFARATPRRTMAICAVTISRTVTVTSATHGTYWRAAALNLNRYRTRRKLHDLTVQGVARY
jgi:hypothetical protein